MKGPWCGLLLLALAACGRGQSGVETALLVRFENLADAPVPDELRLSVYDQSGRLFDNERLPRSGPLTPHALPELGTLLVYPGTTEGPLRALARGYRGLEHVSEAVASMISLRPNEVVEATLRLSPGVLGDGDGDGVPDEIDNCPAPNPDQKECVPVPPPDGGAADGGFGDAAPPAPDGAVPDAAARDAAAREGAAPDAARDTPSVRADSGQPEPPRDATGGRPNGEGCSGGPECASGYCVDGVCCNEPCEGRCRACDRNRGTCTPHPAGSDPEQECGLYTCDGQGYCRASCAGTCSTECSAEAFCSGLRCVADLGSGNGCSSNCQCGSGVCESRLLGNSCR
jgi:hypothetical protein